MRKYSFTDTSQSSDDPSFDNLENSLDFDYDDPLNFDMENFDDHQIELVEENLRPSENEGLPRDFPKNKKSRSKRAFLTKDGASFKSNFEKIFHHKKKIITKELMIKIHNIFFTRYLGFKKVDRSQGRCKIKYFNEYAEHGEEIIEFTKKYKEKIILTFTPILKK